MTNDTEVLQSEAASQRRSQASVFSHNSSSSLKEGPALKLPLKAKGIARNTTQLGIYHDTHKKSSLLLGATKRGILTRQSV